MKFVRTTVSRVIKYAKRTFCFKNKSKVTSTFSIDTAVDSNDIESSKATERNSVDTELCECIYLTEQEQSLSKDQDEFSKTSACSLNAFAASENQNLIFLTGREKALFNNDFPRKRSCDYFILDESQDEPTIFSEYEMEIFLEIDSQNESEPFESFIIPIELPYKRERVFVIDDEIYPHDAAGEEKPDDIFHSVFLEPLEEYIDEYPYDLIEQHYMPELECAVDWTWYRLRTRKHIPDYLMSSNPSEFLCGCIFFPWKKFRLPLWDRIQFYRSMFQRRQKFEVILVTGSDS